MKPDFEALLAALKEAEELLQFPGVPGHIQKANALAMRIARTAGSGQIANLAMKLMSEAIKLRSATSDRTSLNHTLWHLRIALQQAASAAKESDSTEA
jgi:hypothetical protein